MYYHRYKPSAVFASYVECYFIWDSEGVMETDLVVESPPNGCCSIVFNYGNPYTLQNKKYERLKVPQQFIAGQSIYSYKLFLSGNIGIAGIVFKPSALATIFQLPVYEYTEERIDLYAVFKKQVVDDIVSKIKSSDTEAEKIRLLESFLMKQHQLRRPSPDYIDEAANTIVANNGMVQVTDLLEKSCMSRRTFERKFFQKVGLSPKYYARIRRIAYICYLISGKTKVNWPQVFYQCEFYDQAHFIKDFEEFTGRTPQEYLKENVELANFVERSGERFIK